MKQAYDSEYALADPVHLSKYSWHRGYLTTKESEKELMSSAKNNFLIRQENSSLKLSKRDNGEVSHHQIEYGPGWYMVQGTSTRFSSLEALATSSINQPEYSEIDETCQDNTCHDYIQNGRNITVS